MIAVDDMHVPADPLDEPGVIGGGGGAGVGLLEHLTQEPLRGLDGPQRLAIRSPQHAALGIDHLDGVGDRESGNDGRMASSDGADDPGEQVRRRQAPGHVMNQDDAVARAQCAQAYLDRSGPIRPSGHYIHPRVLTQDVGGGPALSDVRDGRHDDYVLHLGTAENAP